MNQTIQERIVSILQHSGLSDGFWAEVLTQTIHIINMSPSMPLGLQIPHELWTDSKPNYDKLRIFGRRANALIQKDDRWKLKSRSKKCIFLDYGPDSEIGYWLWDLENRQFVRSLDVVFIESAMHKMTESPIEFWRVTFSEVLALHDGPTHNMRSASQVAKSSSTELAPAILADFELHLP